MSARIRLSLLIASLLTPAAHGQAIYQWVNASAPPANAITAPEPPHAAACRGNGQYGRLWAGYWDGTHCISVDSGNRMVVETNLQFLTVATGTAQWVQGGGRRPTPGSIGTLPANSVNAGSTYFGYAQVLCSQHGYVGWVNFNMCAISAPGLSGQQNATVLVIQPSPAYTWISAAAPPANAVTAPDAPHRAACRGKDQQGNLWAGYWNGAVCMGFSSGNPEPASINIQFVTVVEGTAQWVSGSGKRSPSEIGNVPSNTVNAGNTYFGTSQVICSQGGYIGRVAYNGCQLTGPGVTGQQNATVLVGAVQ